MRKKTILACLFIFTFSIFSVKAQKLSNKDLKALNGCWEGSITYLDYSTNKPFTMPANLVISKFSGSTNFLLSNIYPKEPKANSFDTLKISDGGRKINGEQIVSRIKKDDGTIVIVSEKPGIDGNDNKAATIRHTYEISKSKYSKRKDVQFIGETAWIQRHEYKYSNAVCK